MKFSKKVFAVFLCLTVLVSLGTVPASVKAGENLPAIYWFKTNENLSNYENTLYFKEGMIL